MSKWSVAPYYHINKFIESKLRSQSIIPLEASYITQLDGMDVDIALPFFSPVQQRPEITTAYNEAIKTPTEEGFTDLPFGVYTFSTSGESDQPFLICGQITYTIFSHSVDMLAEISNYIADLCKREDWTAADINEFYKSDNSNPFEFKTISLTQTAGPSETEDEGGRFAYMIVIRYECTYEGLNRSYSGDTTFSGGLGMWQ